MSQQPSARASQRRRDRHGANASSANGNRRRASARSSANAVGARAGTGRSRGAGAASSNGRGGWNESPRARGERTRQRVAEALLELLAEEGPLPTAKAVADRAGVSVRLVFHHFEDMDALYHMLARVQLDRHWYAVPEVPSDLPLATRIERTVQQRAKLFESISAPRRAGMVVATRSEAVAQALRTTNQMLRSWLETTFAPELRAAGRDRRELLAAADAATSWESWERMRRIGGLSSAAARRVMARTLAALLGG